MTHRRLRIRPIPGPQSTRARSSNAGWRQTERNANPSNVELQRRGFGQVRSDIVRLAFSDDTKGRVQLVHDLFDMPGVGAKPWLMLLAEDKDAEVRLAAVTVMALSKDSQL